MLMSVLVCYRFQLEISGRDIPWAVDRRWYKAIRWQTSHLWHKDQGDPTGVEAHG